MHLLGKPFFAFAALLALGGCGSDDAVPTDREKFGFIRISDGPVAEFVPCAYSSRSSNTYEIRFSCERGAGKTEEFVLFGGIPGRSIRYRYFSSPASATDYDYLASCEHLRPPTDSKGCGELGDFPLDKTATIMAEKVVFQNTKLETTTSLSGGSVVKKSIVINGELKRSQ